jgi:hypothetical protein
MRGLGALPVHVDDEVGVLGEATSTSQRRGGQRSCDVLGLPGGCAGLVSACADDRNGCALCASDCLGGELPRHVDTFGLAGATGSQLQCRDDPGRAEEYGGGDERDVEAGYSGCGSGAGGQRAVQEARSPACGEGREDRQSDLTLRPAGRCSADLMPGRRLRRQPRWCRPA